MTHETGNDAVTGNEYDNDGLHRLWWSGLRIVSDELRLRVVEAYFQAIVMRTKVWVRRRDIETLADLLEDILNNHVWDLERTVESHPWCGRDARDRVENREAGDGSDE